MAGDYLSCWEVDTFVDQLNDFGLEEVGTKEWFNKSEHFFNLRHVALLEASADVEERVKAAFENFDKLPVLVRQIVTLSVWKDEVLPRLLSFSPPPKHVFPVYMVLFYEVSAVSLLQTLLFHSSMFDQIGDTYNDLIDYAAAQVISLNPKSPLNVDHVVTPTEDALEEINRSKEIMKFHNGAQCLSVLRYIVENLKSLPLSASTRIYTTHDLPIALTHLLDSEIFTRRVGKKVYKFQESEWKEWSPDLPPLSQSECQAWLLLRQLMCNETCASIYEFTNYRKEVLSKVIKHLHESVVDQVSPLVDLKQWISQMISVSMPPSKTVDSPLIVEITDDYKTVILEKYEGKWDDIAKERSKLMLYASQEEIKRLATTISGCFNSLEQFVEKSHNCSFCFARAEKKCSKCKMVWYCTRDCQVKHWKVHKKVCCP